MAVAGPDEEVAFPYKSAQAFAAGLTGRLRRLAVESPYSHTQLRRQFAYDRLLARVFASPDDGWILKGGVAMLARLPTARHSADVDLAAQVNSPESAIDALVRIGGRDLGDFFEFRFGRPTRLVQGLPGLRTNAEAWLGARLFERFGVDVVSGTIITGTPQVGGPLVPLDIPGLVRAPYLLYPVVDTVADKVAGIVERHGGRPSTRFRDLADLVVIARTQRLDARALATAIESEERRRNYPRPASLIVPEIDAWKAGYARVAAAIPHVPERALHEAVEVAGALVDPILQGRVAEGTWNPVTLSWEERSR